MSAPPVPAGPAVLTSADLAVCHDLETWVARGGGSGVLRALDDPEGVLRSIEAAGLVGMGGAGFPTALKWAPVAAAPSSSKWVICNGNEDEPGTFKDAFLLSQTPHQVIEGAIIAAIAVGARHAVLYVNPRSPDLVATVDAAVDQWRTHLLLRTIADRRAVPLDLRVVQSNGMYVAGEETAVIATVEQRFPFPRRKPPYPAEHGVHGEPTVVNNVETLAHVTAIVRLGPDHWRSLGRGAATGTKLYSLSGDVLRPGLYELPMGTSLRELVFDHGGGMLSGRSFKAVFTGGPSNTLLTGEDLDVALDFVSVADRGSRLGTGAMIVIGEGTSVVRRLAEYMSFYAAGSCGQCPPCKTGTHEAERLLARVDAGIGTRADVDALANLTSIMRDSGRCGLVDGAATVLASSLSTFGEEYLSHVRSV